MVAILITVLLGAADADPDPAGDHGDGDEPRSSERAAAAGLLRVQRMAV